MNDALHLIVGLGNTGREYANHRHNIGFMVLDALAAKHNLRFSKMMFKGLIADGVIAARKVLLVKPMTYMNLSGTCVGPLMRYYKLLPQQLLVIYDDLDLPAGQLRLRGKGGAGGHNGMRSIIAQLGTEDFPRLRVGIGRPPGRMAPRDYVLQDFSAAERAALQTVLERATEAVRLWLAEGLDRAMNWVNAPAPSAPLSL